MSFVDFMIIGAMKSGTSTLADILSMHPEVCFCREKEPHFFSKCSDWEKDLGDYRSLYHPIDNQIRGEASTTYTCYPEFNKDIWYSLYEFNPKLKFIYLIRDPIDRIVSHYVHNYLRGYTSEPLEKEVLSQSTYINRTRYFVQIKPYLDCFGEEKILLLTFEEFINDKANSLSKIADFLGIDAAKFNNFEHVHSNRSIGETKPDVRIDDFRRNSIFDPIKPLIPKTVRNVVSACLYKLMEKKVDSRPQLSDKTKAAILDLLILDILEIEKLMKRALAEWPSLTLHRKLTQK